MDNGKILFVPLRLVAVTFFSLSNREFQFGMFAGDPSKHAATGQ